MKKINCWFFYNLNRDISYLKNFTAYKQKDAMTFFELLRGKETLEEFINHPIIRLNNAVKAANDLYNTVNQALKEINFHEEKIGSTLLTKNTSNSNIDKEKIGWIGELIGQKTRNFEIILASDLETLDTYFVLPIRAYNNQKIIDDFTTALSKEASEWLPNSARTDWKEAGKCLAFQLFTACGFHLLRSIEGALVEYYRGLTGGKNLLGICQEKDRSFGKYIKYIEEAKASEKIIAVLTQIKELYRNPLMHPEDTLTENEAIALAGISISCIEAICSDSKREIKLT